MVDTAGFLAHIRSESERFNELLADADPMAKVPTCDGWTASDLLWHLTKVQAFWITIVEQSLLTPWDAVAGAPERPSSYQELLALFGATRDRLSAGLESTPPETPAWMWFKGDQTVGYIIRRQAHEACIHRIDAESTMDETSAIDRDLADDGVDEVLRIIRATPAWAEFKSSGYTAEIRATDTDKTWSVATGRSHGTEPDDGTILDEPAFLASPPTAAAPRSASTVSGTAEQLDRWLWGRADSTGLEFSSEEAAVASVFSVVAHGVD